MPPDKLIRKYDNLFTVSGQLYKCHRHVVQYNTGNPWLVIIEQNTAYVYKNRVHAFELHKEFNFIKLHIPKATANWQIGHSLIFEISSNKYIFIGNSFYQFDTDGPIAKINTVWFSGGTIPAAWAVTDARLYLLHEKVTTELQLPDPYKEFYTDKSKFPKMKITLM